MEAVVADRWRARDVFARSLAQRADGPLFSFYEGPPTANARPGVHHIEARAFKDVFPRYRTMKGYRVPRKGGWDCHGIPVELEVERELGFTRKSDIEEYGVAAFNARCRQSVQRYVDEWVRLTERIGFWVDTDDAYWTMSPSYVESVWWSLKMLWDSDLLYEGHRVVPYCPRCGTALSDHEVAQGYAEAEDPSIYVRFPLLDGPLADVGAALLVWTTTPWTLISNTAAAVGPKVRYVLAETSEHGRLVLAADLVEAALGDDAAVLRDVEVSELVGARYEGPFDDVTPNDTHAWRLVVAADFVTTEDGTGVVHLAPAFGADDMAVAEAHGMPVVNPVDPEGRFDERVTDFAGQFVKDADPAITAHLDQRGLLVRSGTYTHTYPFCWRCATPLLYYAKPSWYVATTKLRDRLLAENADVDWHPEHIREGRYGNWLANNVDWALSRERYWGTPLPLWRCAECGDVVAIGSRTELAALAERGVEDVDPHRPYVDDIAVNCTACGGVGTGRRVPDVIDAWYDSGAMPFAQFGYPHAPDSTEQFDAAFPADFIAEAIDQTRGWFYSLMAVSTLLFDRNSYNTVLCLGHIVDEHGRKMSKSKGNVLDPWEVLGTYGADPLRWLLLTDGSPWVQRRLGPEPIEEVIRKFLLTLWNTVYFFTTYAAIEGWTPQASESREISERGVLDRWVLAELAETVGAVDAALERYDTTAAGRAITQFVDDLSNWYVRRSRSRFWGTGTVAVDQHDAFATLHECLVTVTALLAPFTPFLADELWERLVVEVEDEAPDSVHLVDFPVADDVAVDAELRHAMAAARHVVELGRRARNDARVGVRQPLRAALVTLPSDARSAWSAVAPVVAEELNVKALELLDAGGDSLVVRRLKPNFRALGPDFGGRTPRVAEAIEQADADVVAAALDSTGEATLDVDETVVTVRPEHVQVLEESASGWQVASEGGFSVALDLDIDEALRAEGVARELVRGVNDVRKSRGFALDDRVVLAVDAEGVAAAALDAHSEWVAREVLAVELRRGPLTDGELVNLGDAGTVRVDVSVAAG